ncbi:hypothetical protein LDO26_13150 [Luteimonas sp. BDR2-5]|uniref:hypothetical protein n=1 Tax=Proluteimonas luteida TaxID=2878685 RepID=UPI001E642544|nr:hypothetical protein [Luteimonas sp. BDR2-5]MCD9029146.1 hypothetical protein [Luteimonas sp. BDR2-5]
MTWTRGDPDATPILWLHDRYDDPVRNRVEIALSDRLRSIAVRSPRLQMIGALPLGYFWFLGPFERPELTTFGDGLGQLETLLLELCPGRDTRRAWLAGQGEGGTMALTLASLWPERVAGVISIDGPLPANLDTMPVHPKPMPDMPVLLLEQNHVLLRTRQALQARGSGVEHRIAGGGDPLQESRCWLERVLASGDAGTPAHRKRTSAIRAGTALHP